MNNDRDALLVRIAADAVIGQHGGQGAHVALERAERAERVGDLLAADAWREVARTIELLQEWQDAMQLSTVALKCSQPF
jgi:hypothetical protein